MELILKSTTGPLPTSEFELQDNGIVLGILQLRHQPSKATSFPEGFESNIYYEIYPEYQRRGYGTLILKLGLLKAEEIGLTEVVLTCEEDNIASQKIIESNGGILVDSKPESLGSIIRKYKILLN